MKSSCYAIEQNSHKEEKHIVDFLFKNGVAIVIGQGAHYVQKVEFNPQNDVYDNDTLVAYSLGNCLSNPHMDEYCDADGGIMLHVDIDTGRKQVDNASYKIVWCAKSIYESDDGLLNGPKTVSLAVKLCPPITSPL